MALFNMRDSWNVWRRKVNDAIGTVEPVPATNVTYDNTSSGLSATTAQSAIDEIAGEVSGMTGAEVSYDGTSSGLSATTVQGAIDEVVSTLANTYVLDSINTIEHDPATETCADVINDLGAKFKAVVLADSGDNIYVPYNIFIAGIVSASVALNFATKDSIPDACAFNGGNGTTVHVIYNGTIKTAGADSNLGRTIVNGTTATYTDMASSSASTTEKSALRYIKLKKIS